MDLEKKNLKEILGSFKTKDISIIFVAIGALVYGAYYLGMKTENIQFSEKLALLQKENDKKEIKIERLEINLENSNDNIIELKRKNNILSDKIDSSVLKNKAQRLQEASLSRCEIIREQIIKTEKTLSEFRENAATGEYGVGAGQIDADERIRINMLGKRINIYQEQLGDC